MLLTDIFNKDDQDGAGAMDKAYVCLGRSQIAADHERDSVASSHNRGRSAEAQKPQSRHGKIIDCAFLRGTGGDSSR